MPTMYTAGVVDGTVTDLESFLWKLLGRDRTNLVVTPDTTYEVEGKKKAWEKILAITAETQEESEEILRRDVVETEQWWQKQTERYNTERQRCQDMLDKLNAWLPPQEYEAFKQRGIKELEEERDRCTLRFKREPPIKDAETHRAKRLQWALEDYQGYTEKIDQAVREAQERTQWFQGLAASLDELAPSPGKL